MAATFGQITTALTFVGGGASLLWTAWQFHRDQHRKREEYRAQVESEEKRLVRIEVRQEDQAELLKEHGERILHLERK